MIIPQIIEKHDNGIVQSDLFSRMFMDNIVFITGPIDSTVATSVCSQLLYLSSHSKKEDAIYLYINSPGGEVDAGMAIYDTMQFVSNPVSTICLGFAASMGALLLTGGEKGLRFALPHSRIILHQPLGGIQGQASDIEIHAKKMIETKEMLNNILSERTGIKKKKLAELIDRDFIISPEKAIRYGIIDGILENSEEKSIAAAS